LNAKARTIGNYVHGSVPVSDDEENNVIERTWAPKGFDISTYKPGHNLSHDEILLKIGGYDPTRGIKLVG
jgi:seryl-tRNA synthetase